MSEVSNAVRPADRRAFPALVRRLLARAPQGLLRFLGVGVGGLAVDVAILWLMERAGLGHAGARAISLSVATLVTWALNRQFTFAESGRTSRAEFGRYALVALLAQSVNFAVFLGVCAAWPGLLHTLAAVIGAVVATAFSYTGQRFFTFAPKSLRRATEMGEPLDVLIIGAGPAGLTASYLLTKAGRSVAVMERDPAYVGGISRTVNYKGFLFDIGGHRFFSKSREVVELWNEILPDDFIERPRLSRIFYGGKFYAYPLRAFEALKNLGVFTSALCMASYAWAKATPITNPRTFHQWVRNQFGERLFSIFFRTYTEKVWGMSCDEISADWASQRIKGLSLGAAIADGLKRSLGVKARPAAALGEQGGVKSLIESFRYPRLGPGMMWEAAAAKTKAQGGTILMDRTLESLTFDEAAGLWTVVVRLGDGAHETHTARHVISSAPITELSSAITPRPASHDHAMALRYRDFITVSLIAKVPEGREDAGFPDNWVYIHDPAVKVGRVQNFLSWSPQMAPPGFACLGLEYFCFEGDGLWTSPDETLVELAKREIGHIGLIDPSLVVDAAVVRQVKAYPVYDDAYQTHVEAVRADLAANCPNLHLVGRNGMHKYNNQDHAMMTAMLTVENILAGSPLYDVWQVNEDAEYGEAGTSGAHEALKSQRLVPKKAAKPQPASPRRKTRNRVQA